MDTKLTWVGVKRMERVSEWVSEWVIVVLRQVSNYSAITWWSKLHFNEMMIISIFILDQHGVGFYSSSSLKKQPTDLSLHFGTRVSKSLPLLLNVAFLAEKHQIPISVYALTWWDRTQNLPHSSRDANPKQRIRKNQQDNVLWITQRTSRGGWGISQLPPPPLFKKNFRNWEAKSCISKDSNLTSKSHF